MQQHDVEQLIYKHSLPLQQRLASHVNEWQWDERHQAIQTAFSVDHAEVVGRILSDYFSHHWQGKAFRQAPTELRHKAGVFARLEKRQCIYTHAADPQLFAVWWPWGHGATVSVRLFLPDLSPYQPPTGMLAKLKSWLGRPSF